MDLRTTSTKALIAELADRYPHLSDVLRLPLAEPPLAFQTEAHIEEYIGAIEAAQDSLGALYRRTEHEWQTEWPSVSQLTGGYV